MAAEGCSVAGGVVRKTKRDRGGYERKRFLASRLASVLSRQVHTRTCPDVGTTVGHHSLMDELSPIGYILIIRMCRYSIQRSNKHVD